jgi:hypothetical protein
MDNRLRLSPHKDGYLLNNPETDTVFLYGHDGILHPVSSQTPPVASLNPKKFATAFVEGTSYRFFNLYTCIGEDENWFLPYITLAMDMKSGEIFKPKVVMDDYAGKEVEISPKQALNCTEPGTIMTSLNLEELKQAYEDNKLSGRLAEMVQASSEDDNDIICLMSLK